MKFTFFSSPKIVWSLIVHDALMLVISEVIITAFSNDTAYILQSAAVVFTLLYFAVEYKKYRNAFVIFKVDENGLHTKFLSTKWEEILSYTLIEPQAYVILDTNPWYRIKAPSIVCIGKFDDNKAFNRQSRHDCIFFSLSRKQLDAINKFGKGKSKAIDQVLEYYYDI